MQKTSTSVQLFWISVLVLLSSLVNAADFYLSDFSETTEDNAPALVLRFSDAIDSSTDLTNYISIRPFPEDGNVWLSQNNGRQWILPFVEPSTKYTMEVNQPLTSVNGQRLSEFDSAGTKHGFSRNVTTRDIKPGATFASSGTFLVGNIQNGIPVTVVNQKEIDLDVFRVRDDQMNRFINESYYQGYRSYYRINELKEYADLVHSARFENDARTNQRTTYNLNLDPVLDQNQTGIYVAVLRKAGTYDYYYDTTYFTITDIGLHVRKYNNSLMLYSHSIKTGEPLGNVSVKFWWPKTNHSNAREQQGRTTLQGEYQLATNDLPHVVIAQLGDQISFLNLNSGALDLSTYPNVPSLHSDYQAFLYGPRDLYRPGENVEINMLLRDFDGQSVRKMPVNAKLYDARGERVKNFTWQPKSSNIYQTDYSLNENAPTGMWRLTVSMGDQTFGEYQFNVEEFLPETLTLSFYDGDRTKVRYATKGDIAVPIQGDYLYGAPAAGNTADAVVTVSPANRLFPELKDYYFGNSKERVRNRTYRIPEIELNDEGQGELEIPDRWSSNEIPLKFSVSASVYESGGRPITRTQNIIQLPDWDALPGVEPQFKGRPASNQNVQFKLLSVDATGQPVNDKLNVRLLRDHREYFWEYDESRGWYWDYKSNRYVTGSSSVNVTGEAVLVEFPVQWGAYVLEVTSESGGKTTYHFNTQWSWNSEDSTALKPDQLQMAVDQDSYTPGSSAQLRVTSPVNGEAIINVETTRGVELTIRQTLAKGENEVSIDIPRDWNRHDYYLTAMVLAPADQVNEVAPKRALGIVPLPIKRADAQAEVTITTPERIEPNQLVSAQLKVDNLAELGNQKLYATVALVDKGVLNITRYQYPKPESYFFAQRRFEASYSDIYGKIINNLGNDMLRQRFGGDMFAESDDELSRGGDKPISEVQIVSFFSQPIELVNGEAELSFELPSFNGKLEWMVVVYGERSYGSTNAEMIVADKLVTQVSLPRFLAMGDTSQVSVDLHNLSDQDQTFDVEVSVTGSIVSKGLKQSLSLADKEKTVLTVPMTGAELEGQGVIRLSVTNDKDIHVDRTWRLGVRSPYPWATEELRATIQPGQSWKPDTDINNLRESTVQALLTVSNRPAINFRSHLDYLLRYPYGCLEQTTSSTYPWVLLDDNLVQQLDLKTSFEQRFNEPYSEQFRQKQIQQGLERLKSKQLLTGGFGYWDSGSWEANWGTVYATEAMVDARLQGIAVDNVMLDRALDRLNQYVRNPSDNNLWSDNRDYYDFAHRAYAAFVMAKADSASLTQVRRLYAQVRKSNLDQSGLAWMHLAGALKLLNDNQRAQQANAKALSITRERNRYYRDYGSTLRDEALSLAIALELGLDEGDLAERMVDSLRSKRWMSTQERIALAKVARQYANSGRQWTGKLVATQGEQSLNKDHAFSSLLSSEQLLSLQQVVAEDQKLYVSLQYQGAPKTAPSPYSEGLTIDRYYYDLNGNRITPDTLTSGDLIIVGLRVRAEESTRIPDALVVDLLPAGLELENQNLSNASVDLDSIRVEGESLGSYFREYRVQYQEYRDDRYVSAIDVNSWDTTRLYYLARAVTPGIYQVAPPFVEDMYRPNYRAIGQTIDTMEILPR